MNNTDETVEESTKSPFEVITSGLILLGKVTSSMIFIVGPVLLAIIFLIIYFKYMI